MSLINDVLRDLARRGQLPAGEVVSGTRPPAPVRTSADGPWTHRGSWLSAALSVALVIALGIVGWLLLDRGRAPSDVSIPLPQAAVTGKETREMPDEVPAAPRETPLVAPSFVAPRSRSAPSPAPAPQVLSAPAPMLKQVLPLSPADRAEQAYGQALDYLKSGRQTDAETALMGALADEPAHLAARVLLASRYLSQVRQDEARKLLDAAPAGIRQQPPVLQLKARLAMETEGEAAAIAVLEAGGQAMARSADLVAWLAALHQKQGQHALAVERYRQSLALRPDHGRDWLGMAISLEAEGHLTEARQAYHRARLSGLQPALARYADERLALLPAR